jgi:hypothetical protein
MSDDRFRLRDFSNAITDLIKGANPLETKVIELGDRTGVESFKAESTSFRIHQTVTMAFRDPALRDRLLSKIPEVFPELKEGLAELRITFRDYRVSARGPAVDAPPGGGYEHELGEEIASRVRAAGALRSKFREVLLGEVSLDRAQADDISDQLLTALSQISSGRALLASGEALANSRRLASMLNRVEGAVESCLDAVIYFGQVSQSIEDARGTSSRVGVTEADRATAELMRLRELNHCREQIRSRLTRLSEHCDRISSEFS